MLPNPAAEWLGIHAAGVSPDGIAAALRDHLGRRVRSLTNGYSQLFLAGLALGIYLFRAAAQTKRLIVE